MKKILFLSAALALATGFMSSCSDKDDALEVNPTEVVTGLSVTGNDENHPTIATVSFTANSTGVASFKVLVTPGGAENLAYYIDATGSGNYTANITSLTPGTSYRVQAYAYKTDGSIENISSPATWTCPKLAGPAAPNIIAKELVSPLQMDGTDGHLIGTGFTKDMEYQNQAKEVEWDATTKAWVSKKDANGHYIYKFNESGAPVFSYEMKNPNTGKDDTIEEAWTTVNENTDEAQVAAGLPQYYIDGIPACYFQVRHAETATTEAGETQVFHNYYNPKYTSSDMLKEAVAHKNTGKTTVDVTMYKDADAAEAKEGTNYVAVFEHKDGKYTCSSLSINGTAIAQIAENQFMANASGKTITFTIANLVITLDTSTNTYTINDGTAPRYKATVNHFYVEGENNGIIEQKNVDVDVLEQLTKK